MATDEIRAIIEAQVAGFVATFNRGDAAGVAALYTEDAKLLPPNADVMSGRDAIQAFWQGAMDMGIKSAEIDVLEVEGYGDTATDVGAFKLWAEGGQLLDEGKYIVIWKRRRNEWKLHRDIFSSSRPAPG